MFQTRNVVFNILWGLQFIIFEYQIHFFCLLSLVFAPNPNLDQYVISNPVWSYPLLNTHTIRGRGCPKEGDSKQGQDHMLIWLDDTKLNWAVFSDIMQSRTMIIKS